MNKSDSERIAGYLEKIGYKLSDDKYQANLAVVNTCGVRQSAEDKAYSIVHEIKKKNAKAKIILTGCLSERKDVQKRLKDKVDIFLPITQIPHLINFINFCHTSPLTPLLNKRGESMPPSYLGGVGGGNNDYLKIKPKYNSKFSAFVPIGNGCNNFCTYCVVPYARGREVYRPAEDIIKEVRTLVKNGYKEINLIAQNVNSYKVKNQKSKVKSNNKFEINFSDLLRLVNEIPGNFWIRFSTSHPKDMSDELINAIAECDKICEHVHLPAQSGDDEILQAMNRGYDIEQYKKLIKKIRQAMPNVSITTDVIVGFPGETKKQFNNTVKLFKEMKFDMAYISQYSSRPGTSAEKLDDNISKLEKKKREEKLMEILRKTALENNKKYIGKIVEVLVEGRKGDIYFGKTETSKFVRIKNKELRIKDMIGQFVKVKINKAYGFGFEGELAG